MVTDKQVRRLMMLMKTEKTLSSAAAKAGMDEKTARKYRDLGRLPSEIKVEHTWRTRPDPFAEVWEAVAEKLKLAPGLHLSRRAEHVVGGPRLGTWRHLDYPPPAI